MDKNGKEITKNISYRLQFINSARFIKIKLGELNINIATVFLNTQTLKMI